MPNLLIGILKYVAVWLDGALFATGHWILGMLVVCGALYLPFTSKLYVDSKNTVDLRGDRS